MSKYDSYLNEIAAARARGDSYTKIAADLTAKGIPATADGIIAFVHRRSKPPKRIPAQIHSYYLGGAPTTVPATSPAAPAAAPKAPFKSKYAEPDQWEAKRNKYKTSREQTAQAIRGDVPQQPTAGQETK